MKPCFNKRKLIAWMALNALDTGTARDLRAHTAICPGCRSYLEEISKVAKKLTTAESPSDIWASESFHYKVIGRLRKEQSASSWETFIARVRDISVSWRQALLITGAAAVLVAALSFVTQRSDPPSVAPSTTLAGSAPTVKSEIEPTLSSYQMVANRSLDELDELLTRQGNRNPPPLPFYTASLFARSQSSE